MRAIEDILMDISPALMDHAKVSESRVMVCCPFHGETGPSCSISRESPVFCCFGCGESGHLSRLLQHLGLGKSSVRLVLDSAGMSSSSEEYKKAKALKAKGKVGARIEQTGVDPFRAEFVLDEHILDEYRLAPTALIAAGFKKKILRHFEVGWDRQYGRITFPLRSRYGELCGISGRDMWGMTEAKYKIYDKELIRRKDFSVPENYTMDRVKQTILWHGHLVLPMLVDQDTVILAEGFKATMWVYQAGYKPSMGLVGAALTDYHAELLSRYCRRAILFLDNNNAGLIGTETAAYKLLQRGIKPEVARYPDERQQPDGLNKQEVIQAIKTRYPYHVWRESIYVEHARKQAQADQSS